MAAASKSAAIVPFSFYGYINFNLIIGIVGGQHLLLVQCGWQSVKGMNPTALLNASSDSNPHSIVCVMIGEKVVCLGRKLGGSYIETVKRVGYRIAKLSEKPFDS